MSVLNATILRVDVPGVPDAGGNIVVATGSAIAIRCTMYAVLGKDRFQLGGKIKDSTATLIVRKSALPAGLGIENDYQLVAKQDGESQKTYRVAWKQAWIKEALSSWQLFLEELA